MVTAFIHSSCVGEAQTGAGWFVCGRSDGVREDSSVLRAAMSPGGCARSQGGRLWVTAHSIQVRAHTCAREFPPPHELLSLTTTHGDHSNADLAAHLPVPGMPSSYELPDGTMIDLSPELFRIPEMLFDDGPGLPSQADGTSSAAPQAGGAPTTPVGPHNALHKMVHDALSFCDVDIRK